MAVIFVTSSKGKPTVIYRNFEYIKQSKSAVAAYGRAEVLVCVSSFDCVFVAHIDVVLYM